MAHQCRVEPARGQWDRVNSTGPPAANFTSTTDTDSTSSTDISSASCLGKVGFKTLDAQAYFSYDLNFAGKPEEWTRTFYNSDYSTSSAYISRLIMRVSKNNDTNFKFCQSFLDSVQYVTDYFVLYRWNSSSNLKLQI